MSFIQSQNFVFLFAILGGGGFTLPSPPIPPLSRFLVFLGWGGQYYLSSFVVNFESDLNFPSSFTSTFFLLEYSSQVSPFPPSYFQFSLVGFLVDPKIKIYYFLRVCVQFMLQLSMALKTVRRYDR